ncbi:MAG: hypothetical protein HZC42_13890 [Candidatus Eisenbacteria bacterium]|nr:hypothetical protein [Candidatus Eisenbacteria bacterium]
MARTGVIALFLAVVLAPIVSAAPRPGPPRSAIASWQDVLPAAVLADSSPPPPTPPPPADPPGNPGDEPVGEVLRITWGALKTKYR